MVEGGLKILFCSVPFRPSVGGIETVSAILAERFAQAGHEVVLVTQTPAGLEAESDLDGYRIVRCPGAGALLALVRAADAVFHNNISLRMAWPLLLLRRPWVVAHHTWIPKVGPGSLAGAVKRAALRLATRQIAVSRALADSMPAPCELVPNPYDEARFVGSAQEDCHEGPRAGLLFVGRLVSDKGVDLLLDALARTPTEIHLTVAGEGPERTALQAQAQALSLSGRVRFVGQTVGADLVALLQSHRLLVVPSRWQEPFGIVALEAIACGCVPLVARRGGLPEAVGDAGWVVDRPDEAQAWANAITQRHTDAAAWQACRARAPAHLARHRPARVAADYLAVIEAAWLHTGRAHAA